MTQFVHADKVLPEALAIGEELVEIRHDVHAHPETGFDTPLTVARIVRVLKDAGVTEIDTDLVKGGVVAVIEGSAPGRTIGLRADIDALPMDDCGENPWKSTHPGKAHACGHDGHQTWLMGTVKVLARTRRFSGRVVAFFQPAEEIGQGAQAAVRAGLIEKYGITEIFGAHTEPNLPKGHVGFRVGALQASSDFFQITVHGVGTHGGRPHLGVDPIPVGAQIVQAAQTLVSRKINPVDPAVVSICSFNAGRFETCNVVPHVLTMSGTVRTFNPKVRKLIEVELARMVKGIAECNGCTADFVWQSNCAAVINTKEETEAAIAAATALIGTDCVHPNIDYFMSSEDFSAYLEKIPGAMMRIGVSDPAHSVSVHNQKFDFNDEVLPLAVSLFVSLVESRLPLA